MAGWFERLQETIAEQDQKREISFLGFCRPEWPEQNQTPSEVMGVGGQNETHQGGPAGVRPLRGSRS